MRASHSVSITLYAAITAASMVSSAQAKVVYTSVFFGIDKFESDQSEGVRAHNYPGYLRWIATPVVLTDAGALDTINLALNSGGGPAIVTLTYDYQGHPGAEVETIYIANTVKRNADFSAVVSTFPSSLHPMLDKGRKYWVILQPVQWAQTTRWHCALMKGQVTRLSSQNGFDWQSISKVCQLGVSITTK